MIRGVRGCSGAFGDTLRAMKTSLKVLTTAGAATLLSLAGLGVASAAIPDGSGVIHACYQSPPPAHGANLQVIDTGAGGSCGGGATSLTWNQAGPQGPAGPAGATGATGPAGPKATAQDVSSQVTYHIGQSPFDQQVQLDCPAGTLALNGGVTKVTATPDPGNTLTSSGEAVLIFDQAQAGDHSQALGLPRPVSNGASWLMEVTLAGAGETDGLVTNVPSSGTTVTYYVICE